MTTTSQYQPTDTTKFLHPSSLLKVKPTASVKWQFFANSIIFEPQPRDVNLVDVLQRYDLVQHVVDATRGVNTLDLLLTPSDDTRLLSQTSVQSTCFSDHCLVTSQLHMSRQTSTTSHYQYRDLRAVDLAAFHSDVLQSPLYNFDTTRSVNDYVDLFNGEMQRLLDIHAPLKSRCRRIGRNDCRWLSTAARDAKRRCRRLERRFRRTRSTTDQSAHRAARKAARDAITQSRSDSIRERCSDAAGNSASDTRHTSPRLQTSSQRQRVSDTSRRFQPVVR